MLASLIWFAAGLVAYVVAGYPLLAWLRSKVARREVLWQPGYTPPLTLLVPVHNERDVIVEKLNNSLSLDYPGDRFQLLVVDDGSDDGTDEFAEELGRSESRLTLIRQGKRQGKAAAVNRAMPHATGDLVVLSDASAMLASDALRSLASHFADPAVGAVSGQTVYCPQSSPVAVPLSFYWRYEDLLRRWESAAWTTVGVTGNLFAFRRALFEPLPSGLINDEFTIALSIAARGFRVVHDARARCDDVAAPRMADERERRARITAGRLQGLGRLVPLALSRPVLAVQLLSHKTLRPFLPLCVALLVGGSAVRVWQVGTPSSATTGGMAALTDWLSWFTLLGTGLLLGLAAVGWLARGRGFGRSPLFAVPYLVVATSAGSLVGIVRHLRKSQSVAWRTPVSNRDPPPGPHTG
jgi:hypothetical protein